MIRFAYIQHGFIWGGAEIARLFSDKKRGWVVVGVKTDRENLTVYVTKSGKVRIHDKNGVEWKPVKLDSVRGKRDENE